MSLTLFGLIIFMFVAGMIEDFFAAWHTKVVSRGSVLWSGISDIFFVLVVYTVLRVVVENLSNFWLIIVYAVGSGAGASLLVWVDNRQEQIKRERKAERQKLKDEQQSQVNTEKPDVRT